VGGGRESQVTPNLASSLATAKKEGGRLSFSKGRGTTPRLPKEKKGRGGEDLNRSMTAMRPIGRRRGGRCIWRGKKKKKPRQGGQKEKEGEGAKATWLNHGH